MRKEHCSLLLNCIDYKYPEAEKGGKSIKTWNANDNEKYIAMALLRGNNETHDIY